MRGIMESKFTSWRAQNHSFEMLLTHLLVVFSSLFLVHGLHEESASGLFFLAPYDVSAVVKAMYETSDGPMLCAECQDDASLSKTVDCLKSFGTSLGFKSGKYPGYPPLSYSDMMSGLSRTLSRSSGVDAICTAGTELETCLGDLYTSCVSFKGFVALGLELSDAWYYSQFFGQLQFMCLVKEEVKAGFSCLKNAVSAAKKTIESHGNEVANCYKSNSTWASCLQPTVSLQDDSVRAQCGKSEGQMSCFVYKAGLNQLISYGFGIDIRNDTMCMSEMREQLRSTEKCPVVVGRK